MPCHTFNVGLLLHHGKSVDQPHAPNNLQASQLVLSPNQIKFSKLILVQLLR